MGKNIFTFLNDSNNKINNGNDDSGKIKGTIEYELETQDVSEMDKIIKETYDLLKEVKKKKSELSDEKLEAPLDGDLANFLENYIETANNNYKNLQLIQDDFKDLNLDKNAIF